MISSSKNILNIAGIMKRSQIYGPGERFVLWVQGCSIQCKGCWNKKMWDFQERHLYNISSLRDLMVKEEGLDGVTILGGEPLDQPKALFEFIQVIKKSNLSIMLYTGYEKTEIESDYLKKQICKSADILIHGRYIEELRSTNLKWRGSTNQQIIINNKEYEKFIREYPEQNEAELHINEDGTLMLLGYPDESLRKEFLS